MGTDAAITPATRRALRRFRVIQKLVALEWPMRLVDPIMGGFNPFLPAYRDNPYPTFKRLRERSPVLFHPVFRSFILTRHADCVRVLKDARFSVDRASTPLFRALDPERTLGPAVAASIKRSLLMLDPPDHTRLRKLVVKAFTPRVVERLRPRITEIVNDLLDAAERRGTLELIRDFAYPLPVIVIAEMLGIATRDRDRFKRWSDDLSALLDPFRLPTGLAQVRRAHEEMSEYFARVFDERRRAPQGDLVSALATVEEDGQRLDATDLLSITSLILGAGHETTTNLIANGVLALLRHPAEARRLVEQPGIAESAVDELLRYDSPVQMTDRIALDDCEVGGRRVLAGQIVGVMIGAANRDPAAYPDPDRLDLARTGEPHVAFGQGLHYCIGAALARVEAQIALPALFRRFPGLSAGPDALRYRASLVLRGPVALPLRIREA